MAFLGLVIVGPVKTFYSRIPTPSQAKATASLGFLSFAPVAGTWKFASFAVALLCYCETCCVATAFLCCWTVFGGVGRGGLNTHIRKR